MENLADLRLFSLSCFIYILELFLITCIGCAQSDEEWGESGRENATVSVILFIYRLFLGVSKNLRGYNSIELDEEEVRPREIVVFCDERRDRKPNVLLYQLIYYYAYFHG